MAELNTQPQQPHLVPSQTPWQRIAEFAFFVALSLPLVFASLFAIHRLQFWDCPTRTFLAGTTRPLLQEYALVVAATALALLLEYWLAYLIRPLEQIFGLRIARRSRRSRALKHFQSSAALAVLAVSFPLALAGVLSNFCLQPEAIQFRLLPWTSAESYGWNRVVTIRTGCQRGARGIWSTAFLLQMDDGATLNIGGSMVALENGYRPLTQALRNSSFSFDSRYVDPRCGVCRPELLRNRP